MGDSITGEGGWLVDDRDREYVKKELEIASTTTTARTRLERPKEIISQSSKISPRKKFIKEVNLKDLRDATLGGIVTVPSELSSLKEWSSVKGEKHDKFKSPAIFWEIRLKESKTVGQQITNRPSTYQLMNSCDVLEQYCHRASYAGDSVLNEIKEQLLVAVFADYLGKVDRERDRIDFLRSCVPYYVICERQNDDIAKLRARVAELERMVDAPISRAYRSNESQTEQTMLDEASGKAALIDQNRQLRYALETADADMFDLRLLKMESEKKCNAQIDAQKERIDKLIQLEATSRKECEQLKMSSEMMKDQVSALVAENDTLKRTLKEAQSQMQTQKLTFEQRIESLSMTVKRERARFKQERTDWLESFVGERYEWLSAVESTAKRAEKEKALQDLATSGTAGAQKNDKRLDQDKAKRSHLWESLKQVSLKARTQLETLYSETMELKTQNDQEHMRRVRDVLREQEELTQGIMIEAPQLHGWYERSRAPKATTTHVHKSPGKGEEKSPGKGEGAEGPGEGAKAPAEAAGD